MQQAVQLALNVVGRLVLQEAVQGDPEALTRTIAKLRGKRYLGLTANEQDGQLVHLSDTKWQRPLYFGCFPRVILQNSAKRRHRFRGVSERKR